MRANNNLLESRVAAFEQAWQSGPAPDPREFLADLPPSLRQAVLEELVAVDLEQRYRRFASRSRRDSARASLERLVKQLPELGPIDSLPISLIADEYRARQRWGDRPPHAEYIARFPRHGPALIDALRDVDRDLRIEGHLVPEPPSDTSSVPLLDIHRYVLKRLIGAGGVCRVYTAIEKGSSRPFAVKILKKRFRTDPRSVAQISHEARVVAALPHPQIVHVHGLGQLPHGTPFLLLDLIDGPDLSRAAPPGGYAPAIAAALVAQAANVVQFVHDQGFIHCDLNPSNLLLGPAGQVFLTDFGMAQPWRTPGGYPDAFRGGTPGFIAPEVPAGDSLTPAADVYSLGATLARLLGAAPPETFVPLIERCLASEPADRFETAAEFALALKETLPSMSALPPAPGPDRAA